MPEASPLNLLADELGAVAGRIEREVNLRLLAALAEFARREAEAKRQAAEFETRFVVLERATADRLATVKDGKDGEPGIAGERGPDGIPVIPDDVAEQVAKAIAVLKENSAPVPPAMVLNINSGTAKKSKTITTRRDKGGNLVAEVVERD